MFHAQTRHTPSVSMAPWRLAWSRSVRQWKTEPTTAEALPAGDPIPAAWCFDCTPELIAVARDCREGSMTACQLKSPGYQYKDCTDAFPGHN